MVTADPGEQTSAKREAILDAALELFSERGFHGTAMPLVAETAGVGTGTVYRYFEGKEALVNAVYQRWKGELALALAGGFSAELPPRQQFHELWRRFARFAVKHPRAVAFLELHHHQPYLDQKSRAIEDAMMTPIVDFVRRAQKDQVLKEGDPMLLIALTYGAFTGVLKAAWGGQMALSACTLDATEACLWEAVRL